MGNILWFRWPGSGGGMIGYINGAGGSACGAVGGGDAGQCGSGSGGEGAQRSSGGGQGSCGPGGGADDACRICMPGSSGSLPSIANPFCIGGSGNIASPGGKCPPTNYPTRPSVP